MRQSPTREGILVAVFLALLCAVAVLGAPAPPPLVAIHDLPLVDPGTEIRVEGILADLWKRDDGSETLVLLEGETGSAAKIFSSKGVEDQPSAYAHIGDKMWVEGVVSGMGASPIVFVDSGHVLVLEASQFSMSVTLLARSWALFIDDRFTISGVLELNPVLGITRLLDSGSESGIVLRSAVALSRYAGMKVVVDGTLRFDSGEMSLYLDVASVASSV